MGVHIPLQSVLMQRHSRRGQWVEDAQIEIKSKPSGIPPPAKAEPSRTEWPARCFLRPQSGQEAPDPVTFRQPTAGGFFTPETLLYPKSPVSVVPLSWRLSAANKKKKKKNFDLQSCNSSGLDAGRQSRAWSAIGASRRYVLHLELMQIPVANMEIEVQSRQAL